MKIAVGSTNPVKVAAVEVTARKIWPDVVVSCVEVASGVSHQPRSDGETRLGAGNRAKAALAADSACDLAVGIEGGVQEIGGRLFELAWVAALDRAGSIHYGGSGRFELPAIIADKILAGGELGPVMDGLTGVADVKKKGGAVSFLTNGIVTRGALYEPAVVFALAPFTNKKWYG